MSFPAPHQGQPRSRTLRRRRRHRGAGSTFTVLLLLAVALLNWWVHRPEQSEGRVLHVQDGDSFIMMKDGERTTVRLFAIDCPEKGQAFGQDAEAFTADLIEGQTVTLKVLDVDRYDRLISRVYLADGRCLNHELVEAGLAWWYRQHARNDRDLERLESRARSRGAGLWQDNEPTPPWDYRKHARAKAANR